MKPSSKSLNKADLDLEFPTDWSLMKEWPPMTLDEYHQMLEKRLWLEFDSTKKTEEERRLKAKYFVEFTM